MGIAIHMISKHLIVFKKVDTFIVKLKRSVICVVLKKNEIKD